jgi:molybdenum cofactor cytidylyltransferase
MNQFAIIVLAAGSSSRLGEPKQLLPYGEENLLNHTISEALKTTKNVVVVLGSNAEIIKEKVNTLPIHLLINDDWEEGMASSIRCGLLYLLKEKKPDAVIVMVADQPFVSSSLLDEMVRKYETSKKPIVACSYKDTIGVPALFDQLFFNNLMELKGQSGAKKIINVNLDSTETVPFPMGYIDIDTQEDYDHFKNLPLPN